MVSVYPRSIGLLARPPIEIISYYLRYKVIITPGNPGLKVNILLIANARFADFYFKVSRNQQLYYF